MKIIYLIWSVLTILFCVESSGQTNFKMYNDGMTNFVVEAGMTVTILGGFVSQTNVTDGQIDNQGLLRITGDLTNNNSASNIFSTTAGEVDLLGTMAQTLNGTTTSTFNDLTINNSSTGITLAIPIQVAGLLSLTDGVVFTSSANKLTVNDGGSSGSGSSTSHVDGPMSKVGSTDFTFPVGNNNRLGRVRISSLSGSETFTAQYFTSNSNTLSLTGLNNVSELESWDLSIAGAESAILTFYFDDPAWSQIDNLVDLTVAYYGASWSAVASSAASGSISTTGAVSTSGSFTFGSNSAIVNPLPVELLNFTAVVEKEVVNTFWTTATEHYNDFFTVENTITGDEFEEVGKVPGAGNSSTLQSYALQDRNPNIGLSYYRLKQTDYNGETSISDLVPIIITNGTDVEFAIYPNPCTSGFVYLEAKGIPVDSEISMKFMDLFGREIQDHTFKFNGSWEYINHGLNAGIYLIKIDFGGIDFPVVKLIVKDQ